MKKDAKILIEHILECIELIEKYIENKTENDFFNTKLWNEYMFFIQA